MPLSKYTVSVIILFLGFLFLGRPSAANFQNKSSEEFIVITMEIPPRELLSKPGEKPYRVDAKLYVKVIAKNESDQRIRVKVVDPYYQNRPRLFKNGQLVAYRKEIAELIRSKDSDPQFMNMRRTLFLEPYSSADLQELDLNDWYGPLEPGSYRLINPYRPQIYGRWTAESTPLLFEVVKQ